jgi:hypothetical protein
MVNKQGVLWLWLNRCVINLRNAYDSDAEDMC